MGAIATGVLAALFVARAQPTGRGWARALACAGALGFAAVIFADDLLWRAIGDFELLILTGSAASLIMASHWLARSGRSSAWPGTGWIGSFGRLSYEIYLTHMLVVFSVLQLFDASGGDARFEPLWYVAAAAVCWAPGVAVDRGLSTPCNRSLRNWLLDTCRAQPRT